MLNTQPTSLSLISITVGLKKETFYTVSSHFMFMVLCILVYPNQRHFDHYNASSVHKLMMHYVLRLEIVELFKQSVLSNRQYCQVCLLFFILTYRLKEMLNVPSESAALASVHKKGALYCNFNCTEFALKFKNEHQL